MTGRRSRQPSREELYRRLDRNLSIGMIVGAIALGFGLSLMAIGLLL